MKTSLGIWAFGPMVTRFVPGGYQPEHAVESTAEKVARAVAGLGDLIDGYEFHYPAELSPDNVDEVRSALDGHDVYCIATGLHLEPRFGKGGLTAPDAGLRREALDITLHAADFAADIGAQLICWPGIEGYNYPFQTPYTESWAWFVEGLGRVAERCRDRGIRLFLEHKNSEPAMKIFMRNIGMTLHVIHSLRREGVGEAVQVNMDWQHLLMNGENLAEYAALLAGEGLLGHQHANSGWGTFDDDNMVGATATRGGSASTCIPTPRTRWPRCGGRCCSGASSTGWRRASTSARCARRRAARTRCARTRSCTRRWASERLLSAGFCGFVQ